MKGSYIKSNLICEHYVMYDFMTLHYGSHIMINVVLFGHLSVFIKLGCHICYIFLIEK